MLVAASDAMQSIKDGADLVCDGAYDQEQIEAAIQALPAKGGQLQLSEGTFNLSGTLTLGDKPIHLAGAGQMATTLLVTLPASGDGIGVDGRYHAVSDLGIANGKNLNVGIRILAETAYARLEWLYIEGAQAGIKAESGNSQNVINQVHARNCEQYGFHLYGVANRVHDCIATRGSALPVAGVGFRLQSSGGVYSGLIVDGHDTAYQVINYAAGLMLDAPYAERCNRMLVVDGPEESRPKSITIKGGMAFGMLHPMDAAVRMGRVVGMSIDSLHLERIASDRPIDQGPNAQAVSIDNLWFDTRPAEQPVSKPTDFFTVGQAGK